MFMMLVFMLVIMAMMTLIVAKRKAVGDSVFLSRFVSFALTRTGRNCGAQAMSCRALRATGEMAFGFTV